VILAILRQMLKNVSQAVMLVVVVVATPLALVERRFNKNPRLANVVGFLFDPRRRPQPKDT
jgi:hypothetical protein